MVYLRDRNRIRKQKRYILALVLVGVLVGLSYLGVFNFLGRVFHQIGLPVWRVKNSVVADASYAVRTKASVFQENEVLKERNADLEGRFQEYDILKKENEALKDLLNRASVEDSFVLGVILAKPNRSPYDTVVIDLGTSDNIRVGQHVFANAIVPLGYIAEAYEDTSLVRLYSSPGEKIEAQLEGTNASVTLTGRGGGNFEMVVPHDLVVDPGTPAVLPHIHSRIVARVADVVSDPRDPLSKVLLQSPVNIQDLKWVQVLK